MASTTDSGTERILRLAAYLDEHRGELTLSTITADVPGYDDGNVERDDAGDIVEGSRSWETVRKKFQRDLKDLRDSLGIIVVFDESRHCYRLQSPFFTPAERRALISAAVVVDVEGLDDDAIPIGELGSAVDDVSRRFVLRVHAQVVAMCDAIATRRVITFSYHDQQRSFEPYAVGVWRNHWYVMGRDCATDTVRRFRLDRIDEAGDGNDVVLVEPAMAFEIPHDFERDDVVRLDPNDWGRDQLLIARIRVDSDHEHGVQREFGGTVVERTSDGVMLQVEVRHYVSFLNRLLAFREHAIVIEPPELVEFVKGHLLAVVEGR